jgi:hypothetical protein
MFNKPTTGTLNKCSGLAPALSVTEFIIVSDMIWVTLSYAIQVGLRSLSKPPQEG